MSYEVLYDLSLLILQHIVHNRIVVIIRTYSSGQLHQVSVRKPFFFFLVESRVVRSMEWNKIVWWSVSVACLLLELLGKNYRVFSEFLAQS